MSFLSFNNLLSSYSMLLDKYKSDFRDLILIDPKEDYAVNYWSEKFNVSPQHILTAIRTTGSNKLLSVLKFLKANNNVESSA